MVDVAAFDGIATPTGQTEQNAAPRSDNDSNRAAMGTECAALGLRCQTCDLGK